MKRRGGGWQGARAQVDEREKGTGAPALVGAHDEQRQEGKGKGVSFESRRARRPRVHSLIDDRMHVFCFSEARERESSLVVAPAQKDEER